VENIILESLDKICEKCQEKKPLSCFSPWKKGTFGRFCYCKKCNAKLAKERREKNLKRDCVKIPDLKHCPGCNTTKDKSHFRITLEEKSGLQSYCNECIKIVSSRNKSDNKSRSFIQKPLNKVCSKCLVEKNNIEFSDNRTAKDGLCSICKGCASLAAKKLNERNKQRIHVVPPLFKVCSSCKLTLSKEDFGISRCNLDGLNDRCLKCARVKSRYNHKKHKHEYYQRIVQRKKSDPVYRMVILLRGRLKKAIARGDKSAKTLELLGCTGEECMAYLETLFWPGMTRENYGEWHIDHIIPIDVFDKSDPNWQFKAFHFTNLQPLWAKDNLKKWKHLNWTPAESKYELPERLKQPIVPSADLVADITSSNAA